MPAFRAAALAAQRTGRPIPLKARTFWGDTMRVYAPEVVSQHIFERTAFEPDLTRVFMTLVKPRWTIYDVGAHFGYFTLLSSTLVGRSGRVHAFEPTPTTRQILKANTASRLNVRIAPLAAWSGTDELNFRDFGIAHSAFNSAFDPRLMTVPKSIEFVAQAISLDEYATAHGEPDFVKIDAESAEHRVIEGMSGLLSGSKPIISIEVGDLGVPEIPTSRQVIESVLRYGYVLAGVDERGRLTREVLKDEYQYSNVLMVPEATLAN